MKAAVYARVSTTDQHIESQLYDLRELAARRGFEVVREYRDCGVQGRRMRRPGLDSLIADARQKKFSVVLVAAFDRVARSVNHFLQLMDEFDTLGVSFISRRENVDTSGPMGRLFLRVPDPNCTCGMYAGINMQHLIDTSHIERGIHGEVYLCGRLYRHTLGWRAQYAYPKFFGVPANMVPFLFDEAQQRIKTLVEFDVDIYLQPEREACVGQEKIPLWIRDYGYSQQGISFLIEKRQVFR